MVYLCERISWILIYRECVIEVFEAERNWRGKSSELIGQWQETCLTGPPEYKYGVIFVLFLSVICTLRSAVDNKNGYFCLSLSYLSLLLRYMFVPYHLFWNNLLLVMVCFILKCKVIFSWHRKPYFFCEGKYGLMSPSNTLIKERRRYSQKAVLNPQELCNTYPVIEAIKLVT